MQPVSHEGFRLSPQQRRAWLLAQASPAYRAGCAVAIEGDLDAARLRQALEEVAARHDVLRTTFQRAPGVKIPIQVVHLSLGVAWREAGEANADEVFAEELAAPHAYDSGPLLRATLVREAADRHVLILALPPLCADGAGLRRLLAELVQLYAGAADGLPAQDDLVQYVQFSEWQHELQEGDEGEEGRNYWSTQNGHGSSVELGVERWQTGNVPFTPAVRAIHVSPELAAALGRAAGELEISTPDLLLAAWMTLLGRLSERSALAVDTAFDGRSYDELRDAVGLFRKTIPVGCRLAWESPFAELAARVSGAVSEAATWQDSFTVSDGEARTSIAFEHEEWPAHSNTGGVTFSVCGWSVCTDPFKLKLLVSSRPSRSSKLAVEIQYDTTRFAARDVDRLALKLETLLAGVAADPQAALADLSLLGDAERDELLVRFNATARDYPGDRCVHELFAEQAARTPDAVAAVLDRDYLTYRDLAARAGRLARVLRGAGVGPDRLVAVCLDRSLDLVVSLLAILEAGGAYVPIDPLYPPERLAFMLDDADVQVVVTQKRFVSGLPAGKARLLCVDGDLDGFAEVAEGPAAGPDNLAYVIYTSGSTGRPKGVMVPHRGVVNYLSWAIAAYGLDEGGSVPVHSPVGFDLTVTSIFGPLLSGGRAVLIPEERGIEGLSGELATNGDFSLIKLTPSFLEVLNQLLTREQMSGRSRVLVLGGEALAGHSLMPWRAGAPETRLINEYGPTETVVGCMVFEAGSEEDLLGPVPIGRPIANARVYLLDAGLRPVPTGVAGHLHVAGDGLARGYLNRPELTAEKFIPDPWGEPGSRLYRTGDLARFRGDGELEFLGRIDQQVKVRGYRIELGEVESALRMHSGVRDAAVVATGNDAGERRLVAYVVADDKLAGGSELRAFLKEKLPEYMVPSAFVSLPALPLTPNGKVDRAALPSLDPNRPEMRAPYAAPRSPVEEILAAIWPKVLGVEQMGIDDNFFALGGDSIRSVRAVALAKERGIECSVEQLLQFQTIRELAREVKTYEASSIPNVRSRPFDMVKEADREKLPADVEDAYPLTALQAGMLYHMGLDHEYPLYHNVNTWHVRSLYDRETFLAAVREVVSRHPVLRTSFDFTSYSEPLQLVHRSAEPRIGFDDLRHLGTEEQHRALDEFWERERRQVFDLADYPYFRLHIHRRDEDTFQFTLIESHAILDGWSTTSTLAELFDLYLTLLARRQPRIERPLATSFRDYVLMERAALESRECREYWNSHLAGAQPTPLPRWPRHLRGAAEAEQGKLYLEVSEQPLEALRGIARSIAVPLKSVLFALHLKMVSWATGRDEILTGIVTNGRPEQLDGERVRGLFLNSLPFHFELPDGTWADLIRNAFEAERTMLPFRRYPLAALQQQWGRQRMFDTAFTFLHFHSVDTLLREQDLEILADDEKDFSFNSFLLNVTFFLSPVLPQIKIILEYDAHEFCREQVEAVGGCFLRMIERMTADPLASHRADPLLSEAERRQVLGQWSTGPAALPLVPVHRLIAEQAARTPERAAVSLPDAHLSYADLEERSARLAAYLRSLGVGPETVVGILMERCLALPVAVLGVLKAGGAYLPLDTAWPAERLDFVLKDAGAPVVLTVPSLLGRLHDYAGTAVCLEASGLGDAVGLDAADAVPADIELDHLAYVIYTSGSTGTPKGTLITHRGLSNYLLWARDAYRAAEGEGSLVHSSFAFDLTVTGLFAPLLVGGCVELVPEELGIEGLATRFRERADLSLLKLTPAHLDLLVRQVPAEDLAGRVRRLIVGGENLTWEALGPWLQAAPETEVINEYGPTETVVGCCAYGVPPGVVLEEGGSVPIGTPIAGTRLYALDGSLQPVPVGAAGELYVGSAGLARGYLGRPALTAGTFIPDPLSGAPGERLYRTGDFVRYLPDGNLEFLGRVDNQVKVRGYRVELGEVEAALHRLPGVREAVALLRGDQLRQDEPDETLLVAYLVPERGTTLAPAGELRSRLLELLPEYMVPSAFVPMTAFPLTPNGKVDRRALPAPGQARQDLREEVAAPQNELQALLAHIWRDVLKIDAVGIHDSFFDLGGNSLRLFEVSSKLREAYRERPVRLVELMKYPTIASLSEHLATQEAPAPAVAQVDDRAAKLLQGRDQLNEQFERMRRAPR